MGFSKLLALCKLNMSSMSWYTRMTDKVIILGIYSHPLLVKLASLMDRAHFFGVGATMSLYSCKVAPRLIVVSSPLSLLLPSEITHTWNSWCWMALYSFSPVCVCARVWVCACLDSKTSTHTGQNVCDACLWAMYREQCRAATGLHRAVRCLTLTEDRFWCSLSGPKALYLMLYRHWSHNMLQTHGRYILQARCLHPHS